jgi:hypothetical protein
VLSTLGCGGDGDSSPGSKIGLLEESVSAKERVEAERTRFPAIPSGSARSYHVEGTALTPSFGAPSITGSLRVRVPAHASGWTRISHASGSPAVEFRLHDATDAAATLANGLLLYSNGAPEGGSLLVRLTPRSIEDYVVFERPPPSSALEYSLRLHGVAGLRLVSNTLEIIDDAGTPRLRARAPYWVDADGVVGRAALEVDGCDFDSSPVAPWGRKPLAPGADECVLRVVWDAPDARYPIVVDPEWIVTEEMVSHVSGHVAVPISEGRVLVAGGATRPGSDVPPGQIFDSTTGTWATTSALNVPRSYAAAVELDDGRILVTGGGCWDFACHGLDGTTFANYSTSEIYDSTAGTWQQTPGSLARQNLTATRLLDGRVLAVGGCSIDNIFADCGMPKEAVLYSPSTDSWTALPPYSDDPVETIHGLHTASLLQDGRVLLVGGVSAYLPAQKRVTIFDPETESWSLATPLNEGRGAHAAAVLADGRVLVAGGYGDAGFSTGETVASAEVYDPVTNTWQIMPSAPRYAFGLAVRADGTIVLAGGDDEGTAEILDGTTLAGVTVDLPGELRTFHTVTPTPAGVLVAGGTTVATNGDPTPPSSIVLDNSPFDAGATDGGTAGGSNDDSGVGLSCGPGTKREGDRCVGDESGCSCAVPGAPDRISKWLVLAGLWFAYGANRLRRRRRQNR